MVNRTLTPSRRCFSASPAQKTYSLRQASPTSSNKKNPYCIVRRLCALVFAAAISCAYLYQSTLEIPGDAPLSSLQAKVNPIGLSNTRIAAGIKRGIILERKVSPKGQPSRAFDWQQVQLQQQQRQPAIVPSKQTNSRNEQKAATPETKSLSAATGRTPATSSPPEKKRKRYAYVFYLGGVPTLSKGSLKPHNKFGKPTSPQYRGLLFNILVSVFSLRKAGSKADFIILVHMAKPYARLPLTDTRWLNEMDIIIQYVPPTPASVINELATLSLEKFRVLQLSQYERVLYMDADVFPYCNLDYLLELSDPVFHNQTYNQHIDAQLQPNIVISIGETPASSGIFVLQPGHDYFAKFLSIVQYYSTSEYYIQFNKTMGWGQPMNVTRTDGWRSVRDGVRGVSGKFSRALWTFPGASADSGLLYHWTKYHVQSGVSIIVGDTIEHYNRGNLLRTTNENPLIPYSCLSREDENSIGNQWYADQDVKAITSPRGVAPYRDFAQWGANSNKPWNYAVAPLRAAPRTSARRQWFALLRKLDQRLNMGLGLTVKPPHNINLTATGEKNIADKANWRYVPKQKPMDVLPVWSTSIHASQVWAKRSTTDIEGGAHWVPPILMESREGKVAAAVALEHDTHSGRRTSRRRHMQMIAANEGTEGGDVVQLANNKGGGGSGSGVMSKNQRKLLEKQREAVHAPTSGKQKGCTCPKQVSTDPCSSRSNSLEGWLENRLNLQLSKHRPLCPGAARHVIHVVVPFFQLDEATISAALCSAQCQDYPPELVRIYLYDDGSGDDGKENPTSPLQNICGSFDRFITFSPSSVGPVSRNRVHEILKLSPRNESTPSNVQCIYSRSHLGPGGGKYYAFLLVEAQAGPNDVVVVLDGDDELLPLALQRINQKYVDSGCWFTYGSYIGKYSEQVLPLPEAMLNGTESFDPRSNWPSWRFGHPRTFKAHLLRHLTYADFAYNDKQWLVKATDRGFVYRMLELSGIDRVGFISTQIYKYVWSSSTSTLAKVDKKVRESHLKKIQESKASKRLELPVHVVVVCWGRVFLLQHQLVWLQEQTVAKTRQIHVHLLSNNRKKHGEVEEAVRKFWARQKSSQSKKIMPIKIRIIKNQQNWHAFSRFLYVSSLRRTEPLETVIFLDDDQYWPPPFVASLLSSHRPRSMSTWYGKTFTERNPHTGLGDYWRANFTWTDVMLSNQTSVDTFTYGGPGGSIFPETLWLFDQQLLRLKSDLKEYFEFDDVWVSYVIDGLLGWEHRRLHMPVPVDIANCNHKVYAKVLFPLLPKGQPKKLLELHDSVAENLKSVATFSGGSRSTKTTMFEQLQSKYHWDVLRPGDSPLLRRSMSIPLESLYTSATAMLKPVKKSKSKGRAFVCITGQLERLELKNKIETLLIPLRASGWEIHVALVLTRGDAAFTNLNHPWHNNLRPTDILPFYTSVHLAAQDIARGNFTLVSPSNDEKGAYKKLDDPPVNLQYVEGLFKAQGGVRSREEQLERARNHARIYESYQRCNRYAERAAQDPKYGGTPQSHKEQHYDVFIRVRDDVGFEKPLNKVVLADLFPPRPNSVTVTGCRGWHGMNDRFAVVSPDIAKQYFLRPYDHFVSGEDLDGRLVMNPETFLLHAYRNVNINVLAHFGIPSIHRIFKTTEGEAQFYQDDLTKPGCPTIDVSLKRSYELFSWTQYL